MKATFTNKPAQSYKCIPHRAYFSPVIKCSLNSLPFCLFQSSRCESSLRGASLATSSAMNCKINAQYKAWVHTHTHLYAVLLFALFMPHLQCSNHLPCDCRAAEQQIFIMSQMKMAKMFCQYFFYIHHKLFIYFVGEPNPNC